MFLHGPTFCSRAFHLTLILILAGCDLSTPEDHTLLFSWQKTDGPYLKNVQAWSVAVGTSGDLFAGVAERVSPQSCLYYSSDHGVSWRPSNIANRYTIGAIVAKAGGIVMAGASQGTRGLFRSIDQGRTFTRTTDTIPEILSFLVTSTGTVLLGTLERGIYRSTNNGLSWSPVLSEVEAAALISVPGGDLLSGGIDGIYRSSDDGQTWSLSYVFPPQTLGISSMVVTTNGNLFTGTTGDGVYRSTDDGANWSRTNDAATGNRITSLAVSGDGTVFAGHSEETIGGAKKIGIFKTTDQGQTWVPASANIAPTAVRQIIVDAQNRLFAATVDLGVYASTNSGATWFEIFGTDLASFPTPAPITRVRINTTGKIFAFNPSPVAFPPSVLYQSEDDGASWQTAYATSSILTDLHVDTADRIFLCSDSALYWSDVTQDQWNTITIPAHMGAVIRMALDRERIYILTDKGLYRTDDVGTWQPINTPVTFLFSDFAVRDSATIVLATGPRLHLSDDGGGHWVNLRFTRFVRSVHFGSKGNLYALADDGSGIHAYHLATRSWETMSDGLMTSTVADLLFYKGVPIIGAGSGVMTWDEKSHSWLDASIGISSVSVLSVAVNAQGRLFIGTENQGVARGTRLVFH